MEWTDEGIVLGTRRLGEANAVLELLTREHGRHLGLVRGGGGTRLRPILQPGNTVRVVWRARLDEHLGHFVVEGLKLRAASFLAMSYALYGLTHVCALARLLPERDPHPELHELIDFILERFGDPQVAAMHVARLELQMLTELGFGLDLEACAATGTHEDLTYVSPKSGRAVSRLAGEPWRERLLRLPPFLAAAAGGDMPGRDQLAEAFALTGFFLDRHVLSPRGLGLWDGRENFIAAVTGGSRPAAG